MANKSSKKINLGLVGLGRLGQVYAESVAGGIPGARLVAVADLVARRAKQVADQYDVPRWYDDGEKLMEDQQVDAVLIIGSTDAHKDLAIAAAEHDKAIFCEKPVALSLSEATAMQEAVSRAGVFFQMGHMRRFDAGYQAAKEKLDAGVIGRPVAFKSTSRDPFPPSIEFADPKSSGGLILDMGIHDFDVARWFMTDVTSLYAVGGTLAYPELATVGDIDNAVINFTFSDGTLGAVDLSRNGVYGYDIFTEVLGTEGALRVGYLRETPVLVMTKGVIAHDTVPYFMQRFGDSYKAQVQNFVENLLNNRPPAVTIDDGVEALRIALAATLSQREGRIVEVAEVTA